MEESTNILLIDLSTLVEVTAKETVMVEKLITVKNRAGIHARPAAIIAQTANKFECDIILARDDITVNAKSIMGVITMAAGYNTVLTLRTEGSDEVEAANVIEGLFESKFEED